jgi:excisionase family DNA binding protein
MLLTAKELAIALKIHVSTVWRACRKHAFPYERFGKLYYFDLAQVREAMRTSADLPETSDRMRATGGESRRRAQPVRPRLGKTGASIARKG